ncbi:hypothetical protein D3C80_1276330 [compost metagenome]
MIREYLSKACCADSPLAGVSKCIFKTTTYIEFGNLSAPTFTAGTALVTEATQIISFVTAYINKSGNIKSIGPLTEYIAVFVAFHYSRSTDVVMMVHHIMSQFAAAAPQTFGPNVRCGVKQDPGAVEGRST